MKNFHRRILVFVAFVRAVTCLDCHQCASKDGGCRDPYDLDENDNSDGCGDMDTHCYKQKYVLKLYDSGAILGKPRETVTETRGCVRWDDHRGNGCIYREVDAGFMFYCLCDTDDCNSAKSTTFNVLLLALVVTVAFIFT